MSLQSYHIKLIIKTRTGFESFGQFYIGNSRETAEAIFSKLQGSKEVNENTILQLEFIDTENDLPVNICLLQCTLNELAENCKTITKEVFKSFTIE